MIQRDLVRIVAVRNPAGESATRKLLGSTKVATDAPRIGYDVVEVKIRTGSIESLSKRFAAGAPQWQCSSAGQREVEHLSLFKVPVTEEDGPILGRAVRLLIDDKDAAARAELATLSPSDPVLPPQFVPSVSISALGVKRPNVTPAILAPILRRDHWCCRYCGRRLVVAGVLELLGILAPVEFPFPPGHHLPAAGTHPAARRTYPEVDHVHAGSAGGSWTDASNLVATCVPCNERKGNRGGWMLQPPAHEDWTGLIECYRALALRAAVERAYHASWFRALGI